MGKLAYITSQKVGLAEGTSLAAPRRARVVDGGKTAVLGYAECVRPGWEQVSSCLPPLLSLWVSLVFGCVVLSGADAPAHGLASLLKHMLCPGMPRICSHLWAMKSYFIFVANPLNPLKRRARVSATLFTGARLRGDLVVW